MDTLPYKQRGLDIGIKINVLEWKPVAEFSGVDFLMLHGLASNALTWSFVAQRLAAAGHHVFAIDQRGHGLSQKPDSGYDYDTITDDLNKTIKSLGLVKPVLAGQSWGGNVLLEFAARFPGLARGFVFVDGGFLELGSRGSWEEVSQALKPPPLNGMPGDLLRQRIQAGHPGWSDAVVDATMGNFEWLAGGRIRPHLSLEHHMAILRAMYDQPTRALYAKVQEPVLICAADDGSEWAKIKRSQLTEAQAEIRNSQVIWFKDAAHDIHQDRPDELTEAILQFSSSLSI